MRCFVCIILIIGSHQILYAQDIYEDSIAHKLTFHVNANPFIKNNEYFGSFTKGFTGIGFILQPQIKYSIDDRTTLSLGYHFLKYSGINSFSEAIPLFRLKSRLFKDFTFIFGHLNGARQHELSEPLYRFDNDYQNQIEYGIQFLIDKKRFKSDVWLHWEQFIKKDDPFPEELYVGSKTWLQLYKKRNFSFQIWNEMLISHLGGQIDLSSNPDRTILNYSIGPEFTFQIKKESKLSFTYVFYKSTIVKQVKNQNSPFYIPLDSGSAHYPQVHFEQHDIKLLLGYWHASSFVSPRGEYLFFSVSDFNSSVVEKDRKLWTSSVSYTFKPFHYLSIFAHTGFYYDPIHDQFDYTYGLRALLILNFSLKN